MLTHHSVVLIDHIEAHIIHFNADTSQDETVKCEPANPHLHVRSGKAENRPAPENARYFNQVIDALHDSTEILLMGPDSEKDEFLKYAEQHHSPIAEKIIATLTDEDPGDPQLLKFARDYFVHQDWMTMIPAKALTSKKTL